MNDLKNDDLKRLFKMAMHESITPLVGIRGAAERLLYQFEKGNTKYLVEYLKMISQYAELSMHNLNTFSFMMNEEKYFEHDEFISYKKFNLFSEVNKSIFLYQEISKSKDIKIIERLESIKNLEVRFDKYLLSIALNNLLDNALKYGYQKSEVLIEGLFSDGKLQMRYASSGRGILENEKDKIFQYGYRGTNSMYYEANGRGIGLYVAKRIFDLMDGNLYLEKGNKRFENIITFSIPEKLIV